MDGVVAAIAREDAVPEFVGICDEDVLFRASSAVVSLVARLDN